MVATVIETFAKTKRLQNYPWIFLFQNLFDHTVSHEVVQIKRSLCHSTGVNLVAYQIGSKSTMSMVEGLPLNLAPYIFVIVTAWTIEFMGPVILDFFQNYKLLLSGLGLRVSVRLPLD